MKNRHLIVLFIVLGLLVMAGYFGWKKNVVGTEQIHEQDSMSYTGKAGPKKELTKSQVLQWADTLDKRDEQILHDKTGKNTQDPENEKAHDASLVSENISGDMIDNKEDIEHFKQVYQQAKQGNDARRQLMTLESLYEKKQAKQLLPFMIKLAVQVRDYDKALQRVHILEENNLLMKSVDDATLFSLLFNGTPLNFQGVRHIKELMLHYADQGYLDDKKLALYESLITYSRGDINNYSYFMDNLKGTEYAYRYDNFQKNKKIVASFQDAPSYYLDALIAKDIFQQGYWQVAKVAANRLIEKDSLYILPRQLLLYTSLFLGEYDEVHDATARLLEHDNDHEQLYNFLDAIAYFEQADHANAILKFKNIRDKRYFSDAKRYLLLSYVAIEDDKNTSTILQDLLKEKTLSPYDFYSIFDIFFYKPLREHKEFVLFAKYFQIAKQYLDRCYKDAEKEYAYICLYGKTGLLLANEQNKKAYQYLQRIIKRYPKGFIYESLGDIAYDLGKYDDAKKRFMQAVSVGNDDERRSLIQKVKDMVNTAQKQEKS